MKKLSYLAILVISVIATSCLGSNSSSFEYTRSLQSSANFSVVKSLETGSESVIANGAVYELKILPDEGKISVSVSGLQLTPNSGSYAFTIADATFKYDESGALVLSLNDVPDASNGVAVTDFKLSYLERYMDSNTAIPAWVISYTINGRYTVRAVQKTTVLFGTSDVTVIQSGSNYRQNTAFYSLRFDPAGATSNEIKANFYLFNAKFADKMPKMNMAIQDIPVTIGVNSFSMRADELKIYTVDEANNTEEQPDFRITDFAASGRYGTAADLNHFEFTVGGRFETTLSLGCKIPTEEIN
ncbi:MAG: hypothetical protein K2J42_06330 [Muribaculaceae bacterium]|nr:hypothetical protein [Muribaculaceae bacterium]